MMADVLHYPGDRTNFDPNQIYGPDRFGCFYTAVAAEYDPGRARTTISFKPLAIDRSAR